MKKITLFFIMLGFFLTASAQYNFNPIVGPTNVASGSPVTINLNDTANLVGVPVSSTGSYDSFSITIDWVVGDGNPWSSEADLTFTTTAGSITIDPPTTGSLTSNDSTTLTFEGDLAGIYDPTTDGYIDLVLNQSFGGSNADWSNIVVTLFESPTCIVPVDMASSNTTTTSIDLIWTAGDSETTWNLEWNAAADFTPGNGEEEGSATINTTPAAALSGLTPFSNYFLYYQADCAGNGLSEWVGPFNFLTGYCESIPATNDGDGITQAQLGTETFTSAGDVVFEDFTSPTVDLAAGITANFQMIFATGFGYDVNVWIDFNNDLVYDNATELVFQGETTNANPTNFDASFVIPNVPLGVYNMRMGSADFGQDPPNPCFTGTFGVTADFTVNITTAPDCIPASALTAENITAASADLAWTEGGTATSWNIEWGPTGFPQGTGTAINGVTTNPFNITGLTGTTSYDFYVQSICATGTSTFSGPSTFTTPLQSNFILDCATSGPLTQDYCYENNGQNNPFIFTYTSTDGTPLNLTFNSGNVENNFDELVVLDSDGTAFAGFAAADDNYGAGGNISGLTFQSTGDTISFFINSDGSVSCESGSAALVAGINYTISCATCINPQATYTVIDDCENGDQFLIDVNISTLGDANTLTISNNINGDTTPVTTANTYTVGPFLFNVDVVITISNDDDVNCVINSTTFRLLACPPVNDNPCDATVAIVNDSFLCVESTPGTLTAATDSGIPNNSCNGDPDDDVWFQFVAQEEIQLISLANFPAFENIDHSLYSGTCDALVELDCKDNEYSTVTPSLTIGDTYFVRVFSGGSTPESLTFDLCITPYLAPTNVACDVADSYCSGSEATDILYTYNTINTLPGDGNIDCLGSSPNPTYSILQIGSSGDILIEMVQNTAFDGDDNPIGDELDVDFLLWGPYATGDDLCTLGAVVDCSFSAAATENVILTGAQQDEIYLLLITNYIGGTSPLANGGIIQVRQTNIGESGAGSTIADIAVEITTNDIILVDTDNDPDTTNVEGSTCGFDITLTADSPFADTYTWYKDGIVLPLENSATLAVTETDNYQVEVFDNQCGTAALSQLVFIYIYDEAPPIADAILTVCDGSESDGTEEFNLNDYTTSLGLGADFTVRYFLSIQDAGQQIGELSSPHTSSGQTLTLRIEDIDAFNDGFADCAKFPELELIVNPRPIITEPMDFIVCDDLDGDVDGITDFDLTSIDGEISTDPDVVITYHTSPDDADNGADPIVDSTAYSSSGQTIYVRATNTDTTCHETTTFNLVVNIVPLATFDPIYNYEVCPNATVPVEIGLIPTNFTADQVSIEWYLDDALIAGESGLILPSVLEQGEYRAVIEFNDSGCVNEAVVTTVMELDSCVIPQGISPDASPGLNDTFDLSSYDVTKLEIFNRNGTLVYSKTDYTNEWIGQTNDGEELPVGTYFYTMEYEGGNKKRSAWIYINR